MSTSYIEFDLITENSALLKETMVSILINNARLNYTIIINDVPRRYCFDNWFNLVNNRKCFIFLAFLLI